MDKSNHNRTTHTDNSGLTLIEMLVVLVIMIAIASVVLQATAGRIDEAAYDKTVASLNAIRTATVGNPLLNDDEPIISYIADCGSLPQRTGADPAYFLKGLTQLPAGMSPYQLRTGPWPDTDIQFYSGWRGPYIALPLNTDKVLDGWNNPYTFTFGPDGTTIESIRSGGGLEAPYNVPIPSGAPMTFTSTSLLVPVTGFINYNVATIGKITLTIYFPAAADGSLGSDLYDNVDDVNFKISTPGSGTLSFAFANIPIGRHAIRVRLDVGNGGAGDNDPGTQTGSNNDTIATEWATVPQGGLSGVLITIAN